MAVDSDAMQKEKNQQPLPGVWATIAGGFDLATKHWWLLLLPILLDTLFWVGPRLSIRPLIEQNAAVLAPPFNQAGISLTELGQQINLLTYLSLPVIGVPTLMGGLAPLETPLVPFVWNVDSVLIWPLLFVGLSLAGLVLTGVYFSLIAAALRSEQDEAVPFWRFLVVSLFRLFLLSLVFLALLLVIWLPMLPVVLILVLLGSQIGAMIILMMGFTFAAIYLAFTVHGIFLNGRPTGRALAESVRLVRRHFNPTITFFMLIIFSRGLLNMLWRLVDNGTWLTFVSILAQSFISTGLIAATFIFYRDRYALEFNPQPTPVIN